MMKKYLKMAICKKEMKIITIINGILILKQKKNTEKIILLKNFYTCLKCAHIVKNIYLLTKQKF